MSRFSRRYQVAHRPRARARVAAARGPRVMTEQPGIEAAPRGPNGYLDALHETMREIVNHLDLPALLEAIVTRAARLLDTPHGFCALVPDDEDRLEATIGTGVFARFENRVRHEEALAGAVWQTAQPLVVDDYAVWMGRVGDAPTAIHAVIVVPMLSRGQVIGVLGFAHVGSARRFVAEDVALLSRFADLATIALENARLARAAESEVRERKRVQESLRASERWFRALIEKSTDGIVLIGGDESVRYASPSTDHLLGYTAEEFIRQAPPDLFRPDDCSRIQETLRDLRQQPGASVIVEARVRHKGGDWRWIEINYTNLLAEPDVRAIVANYRDITGRKEAEQAMHEQRAYLETLHDVSLGLMRRLDPANVLHAIIQRAGELVGTEHGFVDLVTENGTRLDFITGHGVFNRIGIPSIQRGEGLGGIVWATGTPLLVEDYPSWAHHTHGPHADAFHAVVAAPLMRDTEIIGVLGLAHVEPGRTFNDTAIATLCRFAELASIAIDNARLYEAARMEVAERRQAEAALRGSEARYRLLFEHNPLPMWVYDRETRACLAVNDAAITHYGYTRADFLAMPIDTFHRAADIPRLHRFLALPPDARSTVTVGRHRKKDGTFVDVELTVHRTRFDERPAYLMLAHDVTERNRAEAALRHHALHDNLTDLPNRALLMERLTHALARAKRDPEYSFAVLYLDFDRFKNVNDSLGHLHGDQLLVQGAQRLMTNLRATDVLARLGGDEFVLLAEERMSPEDAIALAERIQQSLGDPLIVRDQELVVTASIGIVFGGMHYERPEEILRDADIAMYQAKARGKARSVIFDPAMRVTAMARLQLEHDLRYALEHEKFSLVYQPIIALDTGATVGVEALVRWEHPVRGPISPAQFIPVAEETGLVVPLDRWVLRAACQQMHRWADQYPAFKDFAVSVNVSERGIAAPDFVADVRAILAETGIAPRRLKIEITESLFVEHAEAAAAALQELRAMGVETHLDDFGIGYSSLNYVHRFPITRLKIDCSFISRPGQRHIENIDIVQTIIALAHRLEIGVTAEGIETEEQRRQLAALSCDYGQGHRFSPPVSGAEVEQLLAREVAPLVGD